MSLQMIQRVLYALFIPALLAASCKCHDEPCIPGGLCIELHGFESAALQGVSLRRFDTSGFYANLLQTTPCGITLSDTVNDTPHTVLSCGVSGGYD
jgi:hypothetical protein